MQYDKLSHIAAAMAFQPPIQMSAGGQSGQDFRLGSLFQGDHDLGQGNYEVEADSGVLDKCSMFDYCLLYYLGANFPVKKQTQ